MSQYHKQRGMSAFVTHPMLREQVVEARAYQLLALNSILDSSTLLVLPTGMGKTPIELMAVADRLQTTVGKAILVAPTNPLVEQHYRDAERFLRLERGTELVRVNGAISWQKRERLMADARFIVATPQVIRNDVQRGSLSLAEISLIVLDESHHASGNHAMAQVADMYHQHAVGGLLLAATASPGSNEQTITNLTNRLDIQRIVSMRREDPLLTPHAVELESTIVELDIGDELRELAAPLQAWLERLVERLRRSGVYVQQGVITGVGLNDARGRASRLVAAERRDGWKMATTVADCSRILTLVNLLLCQGISAARSYIKRNTIARQKEKKLARFIDSTEIAILRNLLNDMPEIHIKVPRTKELVAEQLELEPSSRVIVFATLRDSVNALARILNSVPGVIAEPFIGQSSRGDDGGMSQKQQIAALDRFRAGECNVLVATSVGEEGLDVPSADRVIFYEPVASEIRTIQRRGRTGRHREGFVYILVAKDTRDEGVRHASRARELRMHRVLNRVRSQRDLAMRLRPPVDRLTEFGVDADGVGMPASGFASQERERLEAIATENKRRVESVSEAADAQNEPDPMLPASRSSLDVSMSERLRPSGQSGLEQFMAGEIEASIEAAENIVQGYATPVLDARDNSTAGCIVADHREMSSAVVSRLRLLGIRVDVETLPSGDYRVGDRVLVERKTVRDLIDSIVDGRLFSQASRLAAAAPRPIMILEGEGLFRQGRLHPEVIYGSISSLALDHGLAVLTTDNGAQTARLLTALLRREEQMLEMICSALVAEDGTAEQARISAPAPEQETAEVDLSAWEQQLDTDQQRIAVRMLEGVEGVGGQLARRLVDRIGGLHHVLEADHNAFLAVDGVGPMLARRIEDLFNPR